LIIFFRFLGGIFETHSVAKFPVLAWKLHLIFYLQLKTGSLV